MTYQEIVRDKIESTTARQADRSALWDDMTSAYDEGGAQALESLLTKQMDNLAVEYRHVLKKLERML
jgi:hypothetical protein